MAVIHQVYGYYMPTVNFMGAGAALETGKQAKLLGGKSVLLVTDAYLEKVGMAQEAGKEFTSRGIPEAYRAISVSGSQTTPIWRPGDAKHSALMTSQREKRLIGFGVPDLHAIKPTS